MMNVLSRLSATRHISGSERITVSLHGSYWLIVDYTITTELATIHSHAHWRQHHHHGRSRYCVCLPLDGPTNRSSTQSVRVRWYFNQHVPPAVSIVSFQLPQTTKSSSSTKGEVMERSAPNSNSTVPIELVEFNSPLFGPPQCNNFDVFEQ